MKFLSGPAMLSVPTFLPFSPATLEIPDSWLVSRRMQPP